MPKFTPRMADYEDMYLSRPMPREDPRRARSPLEELRGMGHHFESHDYGRFYRCVRCGYEVRPEDLRRYPHEVRDHARSRSCINDDRRGMPIPASPKEKEEDLCLCAKMLWSK